MNTESGLQQAQHLARLGVNVFPAAIDGKAPLIQKWDRWRDRTTTPMLAQWFTTRPSNYWVMTGAASRLAVLDCDTPAGEAYWRGRIGAAMDRTVQVQTRKGRHYWFRIPEGAPPVVTWRRHEGDVGFDVQGEKAGVLAPPSTVAGHIYTWADGHSPDQVDLVEMPAELRREDHAGPERGGDNTRSILSRLLGQPAGEGGRNDWLTKVAGHYAKQYHQQEDAYRAHVLMAAGQMDSPLPADEITKITESIWRGEHERHSDASRQVDGDAGWLVGTGDSILTQVRTKDAEGEPVVTLEEWGDFDLECRGLIRDADQQVTFDLLLRRKSDRAEIPTIAPGRMFGDPKQVAVWLAEFGCSATPPDHQWPRQGTIGARLMRYLVAQDAPESRMESALGWSADADGFLTFDGVIRPDGLHPFNGVRPDPALRLNNRAPYAYGFGTERGGPAEAADVLRTVLTFHDETICSVFGAWWAACLLKPQLMARTALFPFMAIEASSGSGKTNGFFDLMLQLNGNTRGETQPTRATLRDMLGAHRNGIVWMDDLDDPRGLHEMLRIATSGGTMTKMGQDRTGTVQTELVAPVVLSGEQLQLGEQKALLDRSVLLRPGDPTGRKSQLPGRGDRPQWGDVLDLIGRYPAAGGGLAVLAGSLVAGALQQQAQTLAALDQARAETRGRAGDRTAILTAGSLLLDALVADGHQGADRAWEGHGEHAGRVRGWLAEHAAADHVWDNTLTLKLLPWGLRTYRWPTSPTDAPPAFLVDPDAPAEIWFAPVLLAEAWNKDRHGQVSLRTETADALLAQTKALGPIERKRLRTSPHRGGAQVTYWRIDGEIARVVVERSRNG